MLGALRHSYSQERTKSQLCVMRRMLVAGVDDPEHGDARARIIVVIVAAMARTMMTDVTSNQNPKQNAARRVEQSN